LFVNVGVSCYNARYVQVFAMAGHFVFRYAGTEADFCFVAEDNYKCSTALRRDEN